MEELSKQDIVEMLIFYKNKLSETEYAYLELQIKHKIINQKLKNEHAEEILKQATFYTEQQEKISLNYEKINKELKDEINSLKKKYEKKTINKTKNKKA